MVRVLVDSLLVEDHMLVDDDGLALDVLVLSVAVGVELMELRRENTVVGIFRVRVVSRETGVRNNLGHYEGPVVDEMHSVEDETVVNYAGSKVERSDQVGVAVEVEVGYALLSDVGDGLQSYDAE